MSDLFKFLIVVAAGLFYTAGDISARWWGQSPASLGRFGTMVLAGTLGYVLFGLLSRDVEFSRVAIWVSISLTSFSCLSGVLFFGDVLTSGKVIAFALAMAAAYFSVR